MYIHYGGSSITPPEWVDMWKYATMIQINVWFLNQFILPSAIMILLVLGNKGHVAI